MDLFSVFASLHSALLIGAILFVFFWLIKATLVAGAQDDNFRKLWGLIKGHIPEPMEDTFEFEDTADSQQPFKAHYDQHIRPQIQRLEKKRVAVLLRLRKRTLIAVGLLFLIIGANIYALATVNRGDQWIFWAGLDVIGLMLLLCWAYEPVWSYKSETKKKVFPKIFSFFGSDFKYREKGLRSVKKYMGAGILPKHNKVRSEDYVKGSYKDVSLELAEITLQVRTRRKNRENNRTVFRGMLIVLSVQKAFSGRTVVRNDSGVIGNWIENKSGQLERVKLEDPEFEKTFEVYSTDQVEARYLLTTSFMERLVALSHLFGDEELQCSFFENTLLITIESSRNRFQTASIFRPSTFVPEIRTIQRQMAEIFSIIDVLKLHQKTRV